MDRYKCPYKFAIEYLIKNGIKLKEDNNNFGTQVVKLAIEALEKQMIENTINRCKKGELDMNKIELVKKEILGQEMDFCELDNTMMKLGFLSEAYSGIWENCLQDGNIVYSIKYTDDIEYTIQIFFDIIIEASQNEISEASIIKITNIEAF